MSLSNWITLIAGLGIGSVVTSYVQYFLKQRESAFKSHRGELERRYKVIILLMYAAFDFEKNNTALRINRPDLMSQKDVLEELKAEWYNMLLFASEPTQNFLHKFIEDPCLDNLKDAALAMRKDLGRGNLGDSINKLKFENSKNA